MSHFLLMVDDLAAPLVSIDEQSFVMPEGRANEIENEYCKFVFVIDADCLHEVEGRGRVRCAAGDILAFPGPCRHRYLPQPPRSQRIHAVRLLVKSPRGVRAKRKRGRREHPLRALLSEQLTEFRHLTGGITPTIRDLLLRFRREAEERGLGCTLRVEAICTELIVEVLRQCAPAVRATGELGPGGAHLVERAKEWLYKNHARAITLDDVARHLDVSREHLARNFRKRTGQTPFSFLQEMRLDRAKTLLLGSELSIAEVAAAVGFSSLSLFSRTFQARFRTSPRRYRQRTWGSAREHFPSPVVKRRR